MLIEDAVKTDIGRRRQENQDAFGAFADIALYVVADGMGGHAGGGIASALTVEAMRRSLVESQNADLTPLTDANGASSLAGRRLLMAVEDAHHQVCDAGRADPSLEGMGTTVAALLFDRDRRSVAICHVGDSRVYRIRGARIEGLTEDHTVVQLMLKSGKIDPQKVATWPHRHVLTQALGAAESLRPGLRLEVPVPGDVFLICSDGLHDSVEAEEILRVFQEARGNPELTCTRLIDLANQRGGNDNTTVLVVSCNDSDGRAGAGG